ncbi:MAG: lipase [Nitrosomonas sp.]|jgi:pimeloyl-ACP methyl ester carboxylesterase|uniref:lipase family protein n=1 Tax=Nitrosomonas sp. TaxID=42353 RepID=UPI001D8250E3|nr:lipase [Nitrosomonas sp.]MBX9895218.1 lipase [Nitrosomonas sp.]
MKKWHVQLSRFIFFVFALVATAATRAMPEDCNGLTAPAAFFESDGLVCLQNIKVTDASGEQFYKAALQWLGAENPKQFKLISVAFDEGPRADSPAFSIVNGELRLPKIDVPKLYGIERFDVSLNWVKDADDIVSVFELADVALYNNPGYVPNITWKPYGMLLSNERRAVDLMIRSIPFAKLADAIYDFDNVTVDNWVLIESNGKSSGMDAGVFRNRDTNELALVFRGTETCDFPCSFKELEDTTRDALADAAIGIGRVSDQFKDAFNFAQSVISKHPGAKITVAGHSLGGGLAQAVGATLGLETFAFNSSPVPDHFFDTYRITLPYEELEDLIYVIADVHDPVSNTNEIGDIYRDSHHVTTLLQFNFDLKELLTSRKVDLEDLRIDRHSITRLTDNAIRLMNLYRDGW